jgi:hypothetical protein
VAKVRLRAGSATTASHAALVRVTVDELALHAAERTSAEVNARGHVRRKANYLAADGINKTESGPPPE